MLLATSVRTAGDPAPTDRYVLKRMIELHLIKATG
jgi:hypothetical protein